MRTCCASLVLGILFVACAGEEAPPPKTSAVREVGTRSVPTEITKSSRAPSPSQEREPAKTAATPQQKLRSLAEAINAHDVNQLAAFYTDNALWKRAGMPDSRGREAVAKTAATTWSTFSDYKMAFSRLFVKDELVIAQWAWTGAHADAIWNVQATGRKVGSQAVDLFWFTPEGRIKEQHTYWDERSVRSQIGATPRKGLAAPIPTLSPNAELLMWSAEEKAPVALLQASAGGPAVTTSITDWTFGHFALSEEIGIDPPTLERISIVRLAGDHYVPEWGYAPRVDPLADALADRSPGSDLVLPRPSPRRTGTDPKKLEKLMRDSYGCFKVGSAPHKDRPRAHCFVCPNDEALAKCSADPLAAGCNETANCKLLGK